MRKRRAHVEIRELFCIKKNGHRDVKSYIVHRKNRVEAKVFDFRKRFVSVLEIDGMTVVW